MLDEAISLSVIMQNNKVEELDADRSEKASRCSYGDVGSAANLCSLCPFLSCKCFTTSDIMDALRRLPADSIVTQAFESEGGNDSLMLKHPT